MSLSHLSPSFDRSQGIGASEVGAALGLSRFTSPYALWARKTGQADDPEQTEAMAWGLRLQDPILEAYADRMGLGFGWNLRRNRMSRAYAPWPRLFATPDGFVYQPMGTDAGLSRAWLVEAKAPRSSDGWGPDGSVEVPPDYYAQAQVQCLVFGLPRCDIAALFHGSDFRRYPILANPSDQAMIVEAVRTWWDTYVEAGQAPPITDPSDSTDRALDSLFRGGGGDMLATPELDGLVANLVLAWTNRKQAQAGYDLVRQQVEAAMGDHDRLATAAGVVTNPRLPDREVVAWDLVATAYRTALEVVVERTGIQPHEITEHTGLPWPTDAILSLYTSTKPGSRRFVVKPATSSTED